MVRTSPPARGTASRWQNADNNFRKQIDVLKAVSGERNLMALSAEAGLKRQRLNKLIEQPNLMRIGEVRLLMILFRKHGMELDVASVAGGN